MKRVLIGAVAALASVISLGDRTIAQVAPDSTVGTQVTQAGAVFQINNGTRSGNNLFHSFSQFSVPTGGSAIFNNALDVQNIFSRVTGSQLSNVDGLLKAQGVANLFLMNPNGIVFGPNAQLQLGGSFLGTTATGIKFADGVIFNTNNTTTPLLTVSVPVGLQMGTSSGPIQVKGKGNDAIVPTRNLGMIGSLGRSIALVGNGVEFDRGVITAPSGRIEVGSASLGEVRLVPTITEFKLNYDLIKDFSDITFSNRSSLWNPYPVTNPFGGIQVVGRAIRLDQSQLAAAAIGTGRSANITIRASQSLTMGGVNPNAQAPSAWIVNQVSPGASGSGGSIDIQAPNLTLRDGAAIQTLSLGSGTAGNIRVVSDVVSAKGEVFAPSPIHLLGMSQSRISSENFATGNGGNVSVTARQLELDGGARIQTMVLPFSSGRGGTVAVDVADTILIKGGGTAASGIAAVASGRGAGGNVQLTAGNLTILDGGLVTAFAYGVPGIPGSGVGNTGDVTATVRDTLTVSGQAPNSKGRTVSFLGSGTSTLGNAGNVNVTARNIAVSATASITSNTTSSTADPNFPTGSSGNLTLIADTIDVNGGSLGTFTFSNGNALDALIQARELTVRNGGIVSTNTASKGNAGTLTVKANDIVVSGLPGSEFKTFIGSSATILDSNTRLAFGLPNVPTGNTGSLKITSDRITLQRTGQLTVRHEGTGNAGQLEVNTNTLNLNNGRINASTVSGQGGNLNLKVQGLLKLQQGSTISVESSGMGDGGNLNIDAQFIVARGNSDIIANARQGRGGNIQIVTQGLFGLQYRPALTPDNDITASSEFGINGNVQVNTMGINPANSLNELPADVIDSSRQIADRCGAAKTSSFTATGRGGIPQDPTKRHGTDRPWNDLRALTANPSAIVKPIAQNNRQPIVEATALYRDETGAIALVAPQTAGLESSATCGMAGSIGSEHSR